MGPPRGAEQEAAGGQGGECGRRVLHRRLPPAEGMCQGAKSQTGAAPPRPVSRTRLNCKPQVEGAPGSPRSCPPGKGDQGPGRLWVVPAQHHGVRGTWGEVLHPKQPGSLAHPKGGAGALHRHGSQVALSSPKKSWSQAAGSLRGCSCWLLGCCRVQNQGPRGGGTGFIPAGEWGWRIPLGHKATVLRAGTAWGIGVQLPPPPRPCSRTTNNLNGSTACSYK